MIAKNGGWLDQYRLVLWDKIVFMILLIESSAEYPSVALVTEAGVLVHSEVGHSVQSHAEMLPLMVQQAVSLAGEQGISAVGIHEGPGSYTGLRIGVSLAKGICYALGVPLISVSGFEALGSEILRTQQQIDRVWVMMDARRDEVYALRLDRESAGDEPFGYRVGVPMCAMILPDPQRVCTDEKTCFVGNANEKVSRLVPNEGSLFVNMSPRANHLAALVTRKFGLNDFADLAYYEPFYLKDFVAGVSKKFGI